MADIEINFTPEKLARVQAAWGTYMGLAQAATPAEIADYLKGEVKRITKNMERRTAEAAIVVGEL